MAWMQVHFFSESLGLSVQMDALIPQQTRAQIGMAGQAADTEAATFHGHPTLYLLHGLSDDHSIWMRRTSIERYAAEHGLAVIMPAVNRSFYTNMASGPRYWDYISDEVPARAMEFFRLSPRREDTYVAGLSMGGYGAMKLAMRCPERFSAGASFSGVLNAADSSRFAGRGDAWIREMNSVFGHVGARPGSDDDLLAVADRLVASGQPLPRLYACCGTEDVLLGQNHVFRDHAAQIGLPLEYEEHEGYAHAWGYWDARIEQTIGWLMEK